MSVDIAMITGGLAAEFMAPFLVLSSVLGVSKMMNRMNSSKKPSSPSKPAPTQKGGPGVNQPIDEFDDTQIYNGANVNKSKEPPKSTNFSKSPEGMRQNVADEMRPIDPKTEKIIYHDWVPARPVDLETEKYLIDKVAEARAGLSNKYRDKGNFAYVKADVEELDQSEFFAHSKISDPGKKIPGAEKFSLNPENPSFHDTKAALGEGKGNIILRDMDTEYKILNDIDNLRFTNSSKSDFNCCICPSISSNVSCPTLLESTDTILAFNVFMNLSLFSYIRLNTRTNAACKTCSSTDLASHATLPSLTYVLHCHTTFLDRLLLFQVRRLKMAPQHPQYTLLLSACVKSKEYIQSLGHLVSFKLCI